MWDIYPADSFVQSAQLQNTDETINSLVCFILAEKSQDRKPMRALIDFAGHCHWLTPSLSQKSRMIVFNSQKRQRYM